MSNRRYLEIDSTYRNRKLYPKPSQFEVLISQTGIRDKFNAKDPISNSSPLISWSPDNVLQSGTVVDNVANTASRFLASFTNTTVRDIDFYAGMPITVGGNNTVIVNSEYESTSNTNVYMYMVYCILIRYIY